MKKKLLGKSCWLLIILALKFEAYAQADFSFITNHFDHYRQNVLQEKLYVHTDKNFYLAGEIVWFRLYNVDAGFHKPLDISKLAYVEVLDQEHNPVLQAKVQLKNGLGEGSFILPPHIISGNYTFRAYTNWMKNFDADFYFEKPITVVNTIKNDQQITKAVLKQSYDIQFFPEGGNLVNGIESNVAFRVVDASGKGLDCAGVIVNENGDTVAHYHTEKFGIGRFRFLPAANSSYKAITVSGGNSVTTNLPQAYNEGYVLEVKRVGNDKVNIKVQASNNFNGQNIFLFVHSRQQIAETKTATIENNVAEFTIDEGNLADGISHITLFNAARQPVCERLIFKKPVHQLAINANTDKQQYESRKKVIIDLDTKDERGNDEAANISVAVYKLDSLTVFPEQNIVTYLWLTSDLKGNIESPDYYFSDNSADVDKAFDNLMLTHGWRRFKWEDVLQQKNFSFSFVPEYDGHIISAKLYNKETSAVAKDVQGFLAVPGTRFQLYEAKSNDKGEANFYTRDLYGMHEIVAQAGGKNRGYKIDIKNPFSETYSSRLLPAFSLASVSGQVLQAKSVNVQVHNVYLGDKQNKVVLPLADTSRFYIPTKVYTLDDYVRFPTMEEVLREYVTEIVVNRQNNKLSLAGGRRDARGIVYRYEPLTLVDGIPLFDDPDKIFAFDPLKVKQLDIVNRKYFLGTSVFEGIINFRTYKGAPEGLPIDPNATVLDYEGLQLKREFFSPVYETQNQVNSRLPDFRNLLYWSPSVQATHSGKQQLSFYTSDLAGKYMVKIEGLSANGRAGSKSFTFEVVNPLLVQK